MALLKILEPAAKRYTDCPMSGKLCRSDTTVLNTKKMTHPTNGNHSTGLRTAICAPVPWRLRLPSSGEWRLSYKGDGNNALFWIVVNFYQATWRHIREDWSLQSQPSEPHISLRIGWNSIPGRCTDLSILQRVRTAFGTDPESKQIFKEVSCSGNKAAGVLSWSLIAVYGLGE